MKELQSLLFTMQDLKYKNFSAKIIPNVPEENIIGVRVPNLRKIAKDLSKTDTIDNFLHDLPHKYLEENHIHAFVLQGINDFEKAVCYLEEFLPYIDNWATCDSFVPKAFSKNLDKLFLYIKKWIKSPYTYAVRYAVCILMKLYLDDNFDKIHLKMVSDIVSQEYYVNMVRAWYFATALAKQYDSAIVYLQNKQLDVWTHNKIIQKACESYRINEITKNYLKTLRINKNAD